MMLLLLARISAVHGAVLYHAFFAPGVPTPAGARAGSLGDFGLAQHAVIQIYNVATVLSVNASTNTLFIDNAAAGTSGRYSLLVLPSPMAGALADALINVCYVLEFEMRMRTHSPVLYKAGAGPGFVALLAASAAQNISGLEYQFASGVAPEHAMSAFLADNFSFAFQRNAYTDVQCRLFNCSAACDPSCVYAYAGAHLPYSDAAPDSPWLRARYSIRATAAGAATTDMSVHRVDTSEVLLAATFNASTALGTRPPFGLALGVVRTSGYVRRLLVSAQPPASCYLEIATTSQSPSTMSPTATLIPTVAPTLLPTTTPSASPTTTPTASPTAATLEPTMPTTIATSIAPSLAPIVTPMPTTTTMETSQASSASPTTTTLPATSMPTTTSSASSTSTQSMSSNTFVVLSLVLVAVIAVALRLVHRRNVAAQRHAIQLRTIAATQRVETRRHRTPPSTIYTSVTLPAPDCIGVYTTADEARRRGESAYGLVPSDIIYVAELSEDDDDTVLNQYDNVNDVL